jgi:hypothetical protein
LEIQGPEPVVELKSEDNAMDEEPRALLPAPSISERQQSIDQEATTGDTGVGDDNDGRDVAADTSFELSSPSYSSVYSEDERALIDIEGDESAERMVLD